MQSALFNIFNLISLNPWMENITEMQETVIAPGTIQTVSTTFDSPSNMVMIVQGFTHPRKKKQMGITIQMKTQHAAAIMPHSAKIFNGTE
jgi:hypothetical protein